MKVHKCLKRVSVIVVAIFVIVSLSGCQLVENVMKQLNRKEYAEFYNESGNSCFVSKEELMAYESMYAEYNSTWFRDQLSEDQLYIYNALLYAMEHNYTDSRFYVADVEMDPFISRESLSLDSPFLEQNYSPDETFYTYTDGSIGFHMDRFNQKQWDFKMAALEEARAIVANIPAELTEINDRMEYLYDYVCENVAYVEYEDDRDANYLYDAVCKGASICDGYSNMLMLLYKIEGIECCEAMGDDVEDDSLLTDEELEAVEGHTWVVAEMNGDLYNFDATFDTDTDNAIKDYNCFFGVSDKIIATKYPDLNDLRPICDNTSGDYSCADVTISDLTSGADAQKVADVTDERAESQQYQTLLVYTGCATEATLDSFMEDYINRTDLVSSVTYSYVLYDTRTLVLLETEEG